MSHNTHPLKTIHMTLLDRISENQRSATMQNDEQKDSEKKKAEANRVGGVVQAQATHNTRRKRKLNDVDVDFEHDSDKENHISSCRAPKQPFSPGTPTKRICREKTGTEWQSVLDVSKYGEITVERSAWVVSKDGDIVFRRPFKTIQTYHQNPKYDQHQAVQGPTPKAEETETHQILHS
ncbi:hypothetical protein BD769DRAFT_1392694 [Suillus cothurnatus]|nr:hypothetical protein BD769DRAFT_1392694 [Suillus cothurnatus]